MSSQPGHLTEWVYRGIWGVLVRWFRVPQQPPTLPVPSAGVVESFRPAAGFLKYLKFHLWIIILLINGLVFVGWIVLTLWNFKVGLVTAPFALVVAIVPDIIAYLAIHLRYDTTWYVMSGSSLRIRRGIWVIHETTITFENVQNVLVNQGPLERLFGIANVFVQTAGGGGASQEAQGRQSAQAHCGLMEGVADAQQIRDQILKRLRRSRTAGLGDEVSAEATATSSWDPAGVEALREIRDAAKALVSAGRTPG